MKEVGTASWVAIVLVIIGGLNYGLVGFFDYNLLESIFGAGTAIMRIIYAFIGVAALWSIFYLARCCKHCRGTRGGEPHG